MVIRENFGFSKQMSKMNDLTSLEAFKELYYGKIGTAQKDKLEKGYEEFKSSAMIQEARLEKGLMHNQNKNE